MGNEAPTHYFKVLEKNIKNVLKMEASKKAIENAKLVSDSNKKQFLAK